MRSRVLGLIALAIAMAVTSTASAQPIQYVFADSTGTFTSNFSIPTIGGTVEVRVYLNDTGAASNWFTGPHPANNGVTQLNPNQTQNLNNFGLRGTGFQVTSSLPGVSTVNSAAQVTANPGFNFFNPNPPQNGQFAAVNPGAGTISATASVLGGTGGLSTGGTGRIFIGSMIFTGVAGGSTTLTLSDNSGALQQTVLANEPPFNPPFPASTNGGAVLDAVTVSPNTTIPGLFTSANPFQVATITVVPEPTSMILGGVAVVGFGLIRRYRRK